MRDWGVLIAFAVSACGRLQFTPIQSCQQDAECASAHCVDGVCCDRACSGSCHTCAFGVCSAVATQCTGDCASCEATRDGFECMPVASTCTALCSSATCSGTGTAYACDFGSCCSTGNAPNLGGSCATGPIALLPDGCHFAYDYSSWISASDFVAYDWNEQLCMQGTWVTFDAGADAFPCSGCTHDTRNSWSDTCGNTTAFTQVCP